jgi:hypothetical protein
MKNLLLILLVSLSFYSCKEIGTSEDGQFTIIETIPFEQKVTFSDVQKSVISTNKCLNCHSAWISDEQKVLQRIKVGDPEGSTFYIKLKNGSMPLGGPPVSTETLEVVERYINDLAL